MRILIIARMPAKIYSGGRFFTWIMAEALAHMNNEVYIVCDNVPIFAADFLEYPEHKDIRICTTKEYKKVNIQGKFDYIYVIPGVVFDEKLYYCALDFAARGRAKLVLLNFETPNWFNLYSNQIRSVEEALKWGELCKYGCLVQSFASVSQEYAKEFYNKYSKTSWFDIWNPCINSHMADSVECEKENQIVVMVRFIDSHKGSYDLFDIMGPFLRGWKLCCIVGNGRLDDSFVSQMEELSNRYGFQYFLKASLSEKEKYTEIKKSKILLFPSYFEGYGYPPVEAQYCNTLCIAYDLPVLREISGSNIIYCEYGNALSMKKALENAIESGVCDAIRDTKKMIAPIANFDQGAEKLHHMLERNAEIIQRSESAYRKYRVFRFWRNCVSAFEEKIIRLFGNEKKFILENENAVGQTWKQFRQEVSTGKLYIFGDGVGFYNFNKKYGKKYKIEAVLDNNHGLWGKHSNIRNELLVLEPGEVHVCNNENIVILITTLKYVAEIKEQLAENGIEDIYSYVDLECNRFSIKLYCQLRKRFVK